MSYEVTSLIDALNENGIHVIADRAFDKIEFDFSEHDNMVADEKDAQIRELKRKIEDLEAVIADCKKPDISVSENGVSVGCECGGYHLAKERIKVLEKEKEELDHMRKSWMETAQKWSELNSELQDKIDKLECFCKTISELEGRHQSDCIEINRLNVALEVMTEKYMKLREVHGL